MQTMSRRATLLSGAAVVTLGAMALLARPGRSTTTAQAFEVTMTETEWKAKLSPAAYDVLREHGTEAPGSSPLDAEERVGLYQCAGCDLPLYSSNAKYHSGTGWPSFWQPLDDAIGTSEDTSFFMTRTEVHCRRCGGHLGHVFDDGPQPTGLRYCMNGVALRFVPETGAAS